MNVPESNSCIFPRGARFLGIFILMLLMSVCVSYAQNTKGDRPAPSGRENRFKTPFKKRSPKPRISTNKRLRPKERSFASRANAGSPKRRASGKERPGRPIRPLSGTKPNTKQKAWQGDIAGFRIKNKDTGSSRKNVYPQYGRYTHNPSRKPKPTQSVVSNRGALARVRQLESQPSGPGRKRRVVPRSASKSFISRRSINVYANFARPKHRGERATTKDLAGRSLRKRNFESPRPGVVAPGFKPYYGRGPMGDKPYGGRIHGGYKSATRQGQHAWLGDIAGRRIRGRNFTSKKSIEGQPILPSRRKLSATGPQVGVLPLPPRNPATRTNGIGGFKGNIKGRRPLKGGGSVSGRLWNNNGQAIDGKVPEQGAAAALFQGNIKARRQLKGGGSVSGRLWNNNGQPLVVRTPEQGGRAALYQGNIRAKRPDKGMPNVSGSLPRKGLPDGAKKVSGYPGKWKMFELYPGRGDMGETFTGYIKLKKFRKNYVQHPDAAEESIKKKRIKSSAFDAEGLLVKVKRPDYIRNKNAAEEALMKVRPSKSTIQASELQVRIKQQQYGQKPHAAEGSMPGIKPSKSSVKASEYARSVKRDWDYIRNPSSAEEALRTREPGKAFARVSAYQGNIKMHKYSLFEKNRSLHPDTKFIKTNKNNVDEERDMLTNFKLWWARLFKSQETQPEGLKYKGKKPRYDKGEAGMWYE